MFHVLLVLCGTDRAPLCLPHVTVSIGSGWLAVACFSVSETQAASGSFRPNRLRAPEPLLRLCKQLPSSLCPIQRACDWHGKPMVWAGDTAQLLSSALGQVASQPSSPRSLTKRTTWTSRLQKVYGER